MNIIREDFFHFLWENLHFSHNQLRTTSGDTVQVIFPGYHNEGDGPDYRYAKVRIDGIFFFGDVELHTSASDWFKHGHHRDSRYERVILHVVVHDSLNKTQVRASDGTAIPTLELRSSLPISLARLWRAFHRPAALPCSGIIREIPGPVFQDIMEKWDHHYFHYRLDRMLELCPAETPLSRAWQKMLIRGIFQGLGYSKNQENMVRLANIVMTIEQPWKRPAAEKRQTDMQQVPESMDRESGSELDARITRQWSRLLLRQAGLEPGQAAAMSRTDWDFSASRPANQPAMRIRQAAELYLRMSRLSPRVWLKKPVDETWKELCRLQYHTPPGKQRCEILFHNIILPSVYLLGRWLHHKKTCDQVRAHWTRQHIQLPRKTEQILKKSGIPPGRHYFRLATLHHFKYFCSEKRCVECRVMKYLAQT